ncbi:MAG: VTT domain-containing protein [Ilumatobacteraceae bacterium]
MIALLPFWLEPSTMLERGGLIILALVVFAESGLLIGFFLPGDSLLFVAGFLTSSAGGNRLPAIPIVMAVTCVAAIAGDQVGYLIGRRLGPALFDRPRSRLFRPAHVERTQRFLERHGARTIVLARWVPIVRTFAPIIAGVGSMRYRTFVLYNIIGGVAWGCSVTLAGHLLGQFDVVRNHVELAALAVVALSLLPVAFELVRHRRGIAAVATVATGTENEVVEPVVTDG